MKSARYLAAALVVVAAGWTLNDAARAFTAREVMPAQSDFLVRARALLTEESGRDAGRLDLATLGRRLRLLVGRNEGLHALIAHLGGHLRPVA